MDRHCYHHPPIGEPPVPSHAGEGKMDVEGKEFWRGYQEVYEEALDGIQRRYALQIGPPKTPQYCPLDFTMAVVLAETARNSTSCSGCRNTRGWLKGMRPGVTMRGVGFSYPTCRESNLHCCICCRHIWYVLFAPSVPPIS